MRLWFNLVSVWAKQQVGKFLRLHPFFASKNGWNKKQKRIFLHKVHVILKRKIRNATTVVSVQDLTHLANHTPPKTAENMKNIFPKNLTITTRIINVNEAMTKRALSEERSDEFARWSWILQLINECRSGERFAQLCRQSCPGPGRTRRRQD